MKHTNTIQKLMMTFVVFATAIVLTGKTHASVIAYDDLESAALGTLGGQTSGTGFAAGYALASGAVGVVTNQTLSYTSGPITVDGGTNCILLVTQDKTVFTRAIGTQNSDTLYLSFLFRTPTADGNSEDFLSFGFSTGVSETTAGVIHRLNSTGTDHYFGLRRSSSAEMKTNLGTTINQTYFVVLRLRKATPGAANPYTDLSLFVDPSSVYEPTPTLVYTNTAWSAASYIAARVTSMEAGDRYYLDNLCIGQTYDDVVFPNGSPVVSTPTISPNGGSFSGSATVTLSTTTADASIRYTTDGSAPSSTTGTLYSGPFSLSASARVRAIAYKDGLYDSALSSSDFRVAKQWTGLGADNNWSTTGNWNNASSLTGADILFGVEDTSSSSSTVNNIFDASLSVGSLSYTNTGSTSYHVTQIGPGTTLTVDGSTSPVNALFVGRTVNQTKTTYTRVVMTGGGVLAVNTPASDVLVTKVSDNEHGEAFLNLSGLSTCNMNVKDFAVSRYDRSAGFVTLAPTNSIVAKKLGVGDSGGYANGDTSTLTLGRINTFHIDRIGIGAAVLSTHNENGGSVAFAAGLVNPTLTIRGSSGGTSRADLALASHGYIAGTSARSIVGTLNVVGGTLDARIGSLILGQGRGGTAGRSSVLATLSMNAGLLDAETAVIGSSRGGSSVANPATGNLNVSGGQFVAGSATVANNISGTQATYGNLNVSGTGLVEINGDVVLGTRVGTAPNVGATVNLTGGNLIVRGNMAPGSNPTNVVSTVTLNGGQLTVTNATTDATLRIERGTFGLTSGPATLDRLVTTNALATTQVTLSGIDSGDFGQVTVNEDVRLGGTLNVVLNGYTLHGGESWTIVGGTGTRTGTFASITPPLPEGMSIVYTTNGYKLVCPAQSTLMQIR